MAASGADLLLFRSRGRNIKAAGAIVTGARPRPSTGAGGRKYSGGGDDAEHPDERVEMKGKCFLAEGGGGETPNEMFISAESGIEKEGVAAEAKH